MAALSAHDEAAAPGFVRSFNGRRAPRCTLRSVKSGPGTIFITSFSVASGFFDQQNGGVHDLPQIVQVGMFVAIPTSDATRTH